MGELAGIAVVARVQSFRERSPVPRLHPYVISAWIQQVPPDSPPYRHRTAPNGSAELIWQPSGVPTLVGPQSGPTEQLLPPGTVAVGLRLRPGALPALFGIPAGEFVDQTVELADICDDRAATMADLVAGSPSPVDATAALEAAVLTLLPEDAVPDPVVTEAVRRLMHGQGSDIVTLAADIGVSARNLRRRCKAGVGFPPKSLHRILRLQRFLALTRRHEVGHVNLALLAAQAGFADQAHLCREFLRLTGRSPRTALHEAEHNCAGRHDHRASDAALLSPIPAVRPH